MMEPTAADPASLVVSTVPRVTKSIKTLLEKVREDFKSQDIHQFIDRANKNGITQLYSLMPVYADCFIGAQVRSRARLEQAWTSVIDNPTVKETVDELLQAEKDFEGFVEQVERELCEKESQCAVKSSALSGHQLPSDLTVLAASTGKLCRLEDCWKDSKYTLFVLIRHFGCSPCRSHIQALLDSRAELEGRGCKVVLVARGTEPSAKRWMEINNFPYPLILDLGMKFYRELGLKRSVAGVWTISALNAYAEERVAGVLDSTSYEGDDIHVMGGDFVSNSTGSLVLAYCSEDSEDRPSVDAILRTLDTDATRQ